MDKATYKKLLQDERWIEKRNEILSRDNNTCQKCGCRNSYLSVHHKYYENDLMPWEYPNSALITLCQKCHDEEHKDRIETPKVSRYKRVNIPICNDEKNYFWIKGSSKRMVYFHINDTRLELDDLQVRFLIRRLQKILDTF